MSVEHLDDLAGFDGVIVEGAGTDLIGQSLAVAQTIEGDVFVFVFAVDGEDVVVGGSEAGVGVLEVAEIFFLCLELLRNCQRFIQQTIPNLLQSFIVVKILIGLELIRRCGALFYVFDIRRVSVLARLGYNLEDATKISDSAVMFKQVGDGVQSMDDATSDIISAMKAFNIEADKSLTITDRYNEVGNSFSITSAGVAEALKRSASSLHTAGNDIDQSIGMIVAANDVVQDPDSVGAGLRVIALRIRGATSELESMGEETDTVVKSTAKLQAEIKAISGVNILESDNATFKSTYQIMDELSAKWSQLSDIQKATLTDKIAGKNRANIFSSMMENWEDAKKAMETSKNSAGSATKELDTYLSSIEGKLSRFQATFQSFSSDVLNSGVVKGFIDMGTAALDFADGLVKAGDAMPTILTALSAVASMTNTKAGVNMPTYATGIAA